MKASWAKAFIAAVQATGERPPVASLPPKGRQQAHDGAGVAGRLQDDLSLDLGQIVGTFPGVQVVLPPGGVPGNVI
jgi:hypothetical protein